MSDRQHRKPRRRRSPSAGQRARVAQAGRGVSHGSAPVRGGLFEALRGDVSPAQRLVWLGLMIVLVVAAVLVGGDLRTVLLLAVVAGVPVILPLAFVLLISLTADWGENEAARPIPRRLAQRICLALAGVLAAIAIGWYGLAPGVASYQIGTALTLPALGVVMWWLHRHLPRSAQWALAVVLAPVGPIGYLIFGGSDWWAAYGLTVLPLAILVLACVPRSPAPATRSSVTRSSVPGWIDGPWGPP